MKEKTVENKVRRWALANGWLVIKFTPQGDKGWPDRIFISPEGVHVWIEFKKPGKEPTALQDYRIEELQAHGVYALWADNAQDAIAELEYHD